MLHISKNIKSNLSNNGKIIIINALYLIIQNIYPAKNLIKIKCFPVNNAIVAPWAVNPYIWKTAGPTRGHLGIARN